MKEEYKTTSFVFLGTPNAIVFEAANRSVEKYKSKKDWPQHKNLGKRHGGMSVCGILEFMIWKTKGGWHCEQIN